MEQLSFTRHIQLCLFVIQFCLFLIQFITNYVCLTYNYAGLYVIQL